MTTFYVPVERKALAADHPHRWMILVVDAVDSVTALVEASRQARAMRLASHAIWAAVRDIPSFRHMQELRNGMSALKGVRMRYKRSERRIPGYV